MDGTLVTALVWIVIVIGLIGTILPGLPGVGLIFLGILGHAWYFGFDEIGITTLVILGVVALLSFIFDILSGAFGAKYFGSTRAGVIGSIIGAIIGGIIFQLFGLLAGVFLGAVVGELVFAKKDMHESFRAGMGSVIGFLGGTVLKLILGVILIVTFIVKVYF